MPPISKIDVDLTTKCCTPASTMGFCQQNEKPKQKGGEPNKGFKKTFKDVSSQDQTAINDNNNEFPRKDKVEDDLPLLTSPPKSCEMSSYEISSANPSYGNSGNCMLKDISSTDYEQNCLAANGCEKKEAECATVSSTCSSLSSLTASDNELGSLGNSTTQEIHKKLNEEKNNASAPLQPKMQTPISALIDEVKDMTIKKKNDERTKQAQKSEVHDVCLDDFSSMQLLGKGAFGYVSLVIKNTEPDRNVYALKIIPKKAVKENNMYKVHFKSERKALELVRNGRFLPKLHYAFQSTHHLFLVMDFASGGQLLNQFIGKNVLFENHMRVYMAELLLAVDYLHKQGIVHRDIKPENILLDKYGHIVLIDFGLCHLNTDPPATGVVGTHPYIAPEILKRLPQDRMVDFWSLGVLGYEMVTGCTPFDLQLSDEMLKKAVLEKNPWFSSKLFHNPCKALLTGLMQKNPRQRLGAITKAASSGMKGVMAHKFFKCIDWAKAEKGLLTPPNIPDRFIFPKTCPLHEPKEGNFRCHFENYSYSWLQASENSS